MFLAHFAAGFAAKPLAPRTSLGSFLAAQFIDLLWPTLLALGIEHVRIEPGATRVVPLDFADYPVSHSLVAVIGWAVLVALIYRALRRYPRGAWVLGALVISHWLLDLVVHRPDLPLYPGSVKLGLGLWSSLPATLALELGLFGGGVWLYLRASRARDRIGRWALGALIVFLLGIYAANVFGPPPPDAAAIAWAGHAQWLLVAWAYWIDAHRGALGVQAG